MSIRNALSVRSRLARKLAAYIAVAGSAAMATEGEAAIVYTDLGPDGVVLPTVGMALNIDLDHDGIVDFKIIRSTSDSADKNVSSTVVCGYPFGDEGRRVFYGRLLEGDVIQTTAYHLAMKLAVRWHYPREGGSGAAGPFVERICTATQYGSYSCITRFLSGFVGLNLNLEDGVHAGWLSVTQEKKLDGFAYETEPGVPIVAGDTGLPIGGHGDTDRDGDVDLDDLNNVRNQFGQQGAEILGDDDRDGDVDLDDLNSVRNKFGAGGTNPVPEPPSLLLLAAGAAGLAALRAKRNRSECEQN